MSGGRPVPPGAPGYRVCSRCIMDTTDPDIVFDGDGVCSHCHRYRSLVTSPRHTAKRQPGALDRLVAEMKEAGRGRRYDCVIGLSGGVDSSYVAYLCKSLGLRPLAVHLDNGWDSEVAVGNIERLVDRLGLDLHTVVLDWESFRDLQVAFLRASTPDCEIPTDHAILASLYQAAARFGVRHILSGHNRATEGGGVPAWSQGHGDWRYIRSVHRRHGRRRLRGFPHYGPLRFARYALVQKIRWDTLLDYVDYHKEDAMRLLQREVGWRPYAAKHGESTYTAFYQDYILPRKFGFDKRRLHLSSLVWSGQLSRQEALERMARPAAPERELERAKRYVVKKLGLSPEEFDGLMAQPPRRFEDYPSYTRLAKANPRVLAWYLRTKRR